MHRACVCCGEPISSLEESSEHWDKELELTLKKKGYIYAYLPDGNAGNKKSRKNDVVQKYSEHQLNLYKEK